MAEFVGSFAASHAPLIARDWDKLPEARRQEITAAFQELGKRVTAAEPDVLIVLSPDHWVNFFLNNLPSVCIGVGETHGGPPEPFMKSFTPSPIPGHAALGAHIAKTALGNDFEPSISHQMTLDHGFCIPMWRMELAKIPLIVPIVINDIEPPMLSMSRCIAWGKLLAKAIASFPDKNLRVGVLATGGLSHSIGAPDMGRIDEPFDRECIRLFEKGPEGALVDFLEAHTEAAGNGAHEVRNWVIAHAAAGGRGFDLIDYRVTPEVYVGCGWASWRG